MTQGERDENGRRIEEHVRQLYERMAQADEHEQQRNKDHLTSLRLPRKHSESAEDGRKAAKERREARRKIREAIRPWELRRPKATAGVTS